MLYTLFILYANNEECFLFLILRCEYKQKIHLNHIFFSFLLLCFNANITGKSLDKITGSVKSMKINHSRDGFREQCLLDCMWQPLILVEAYQPGLVSILPWIWQWAHIPPGSQHGEGRLISRLGQLPATHTTSELSVLTSGNIQEHGAPSFLFGREVCHVGRPPGHACIFSYILL